jgi:reactive intermediate/imine deaminase
MSAGEAIEVPGAPPPAGHYSAGVKHGGLVYVSGQLGARADGSHTFGEPFEVQVRAALDNVFGVLDAAGCGREDLLKVTVYLVGVDNWPWFNAIYAEAMGDAKPARAVVPVPELHHGYLVEIEAIAACPQ